MGHEFGNTPRRSNLEKSQNARGGLSLPNFRGSEFPGREVGQTTLQPGWGAGHGKKVGKKFRKRE